MGGTFNAYKYVLKGDIKSVEQTINASRENGTVFFDQAVSLTLPQLSKEDNNEIEDISLRSSSHCCRRL